MCIVCGFPNCTCPTIQLLPCVPCGEENGCNPKVPAKCVTIDDTNVDVRLQCNNFLDYIYACIVANPAQYEKYCLLWDACSDVCASPNGIVVSINILGLPGSVDVTWTTVAGVTYDIYLDDILLQTNATSPYTLVGVTYSVTHTVKIISNCPNGASNFATQLFSLCAPATDFAVNVELSNSNNLLVEWIMLVGVVYDLYKDGVLVQIAATSPYVYTGLIPDTLYTLKIVSRCTAPSVQTLPTTVEITYTTDP